MPPNPAKARQKLSKLFKNIQFLNDEDIKDEEPAESMDPRHQCCYKGETFFNALKALFTRNLFLLHAFLAIWRVVLTKHPWYWLLCLVFLSLFVEMILVIAINRAQEWKMFCPSVFLYLLCLVPSIWILELDKFDRINYYITSKQNETSVVEEALFRVGSSLSIPALSSDEWMLILEQALLVIVIIGRWLLPKGSLTRNQLSSLLLIYMATASDIIDFFTIISEVSTSGSRGFVCVVLTVWTWSLMQFPFVMTSADAGLVKKQNHHEDDHARPCYLPIMGCLRKFTRLMETDAWSILVSLTMQDGPYVIVRIIAIFSFKVETYSNYFFTAKNSFVLLLNLYRFAILLFEYKEMRQEQVENAESETKFKDYVLDRANGKGEILLTM